jgi:CxxC motif-containing protein (DUF1111 family)
MAAVLRAESWRGGLWRLRWIVAVGPVVVWSAAPVRTEPDKRDPVAIGYEIFNREWLPNDARSHGGDGLGPVYNDSSCVACHNAGGPGGAGPISKNIDLLSAALASTSVVNFTREQMPPSPSASKTPATAKAPADAKPSPLKALVALHPGFRISRNVVLHKFGTDPNYRDWRRRMLESSANHPSRALIDLRGTIMIGGANFDDAQSTTGPPNDAPLEMAAMNARLAQLRERMTEARDRLAKMRDSSATGGAKSVGAISHPTKKRTIRESSSQNGQRSAVSSTDGAAIDIAEVQAEVAADLARLQRVVEPVGESTTITRSQRNPTALFGMGLIDAIPTKAIEDMAERQAKETTSTKGRVSRLSDGRIGRLGWKGQVASVEDFVLNACAVELGLEVPGHHQAQIPQAPRYKATGLDLTAEECSALVAYVKSLPKPIELQAAGGDQIAAGRAKFTSIGCANCHSPTLGDVEGIYSDLLLHEMGAELGEEGSYTDSSSSDDAPIFPGTPRDVASSSGGSGPTNAARSFRGATRQEWRTPPLWGFRDSGPYLHDGRAQTLEKAVALHGGQGENSAHLFFALQPAERLQVEAFLKSLVAPPSGQLASR